MQRYPHLKYLRYLAAFYANSPQELIDLSRAGGYPSPSGVDAEALMEWASELPPDHEATTPDELVYSDEAMEILDSVGATLFLSESRSIAGAEKINRSSRAKQVIQVAAIAGERDPSRLSELVKKLLGKKYLPSDIASYLRLFWDCADLVAEEWRQLYHGNKTMADKMFQASVSGSLAYALWVIGHRVEIDTAEAWRLMRHQGFMRFMETATMKNGLQTSSAAKNWADIAAQADDRLRESEPMNDLLLSMMKKIRISVDNEQPPNAGDLGELTEG